MAIKETPMSRIYTVVLAATVTAAGTDTDWFEVTPTDDKPVKLRGLVLGQTSEFADAAEEIIRFSIIRLPATVTSGNGSAATPQPTDDIDVAAGFAAEVNGTTVATTSGTAVTLAEFSWNLRNTPYEMWWPDPEFAPKVRQAAAMVLRMQSTLADDISATMTAYFEEE
jgi:hypothetical protein